MNSARYRWLLLALIVSLPLAMAASVVWGTSDLDPLLALRILAGGAGDHLPQGARFIIMDIRLPRVILAALVGAALAVGGCALQGLFRNPLAEPGILGVSSGGALGAVIAIFLGFQASSLWVLPSAAFAGALASALAVFAIATTKGRTPLATLLLAGIAMNALLSAAVSFLLTLRLGRFDSAQQIIHWLIGGLQDRTWLHVKMAVGPILLGSAATQFLARDLNSISLGEETASSLGVSVQRLKIAVLVLVSILTGVAVAVSGVLAFVGLIIPQLFRLFAGPDHRRLLPLSALGGALFLVVIDLIGRVVARPMEIRIGILTSLLGGPFFLFLLMLSRRKGRLG